jgi:hypothetical protein
MENNICSVNEVFFDLFHMQSPSAVIAEGEISLIEGFRGWQVCKAKHTSLTEQTLFYI